MCTLMRTIIYARDYARCACAHELVYLAKLILAI